MTETPLAELVEVLDRQRVPVNRAERAERVGDVPYYGATGQVGWIDDFLFDEELVLLGEDGVPFLDPTKPKAYVVRGKSWVNNHAHVLRPRSDAISAEYLRHALNAVDYAGLVNGTTRLKLTKTAMLRIRLPLPPLDEQRQVVARIELLQSEIDAGLNAAAHAGAGAARLVPAALEEDVRRVEADGCDRATAQELAADVPYALAIGPFGSDLKVSDYADAGVPLVFVRNIRAQRFDGSGAKFVSHEKAEELRAHRVQAGDLLITKMGDPPGDCAIYPHDAPDAIITADCIRMVVNESVARRDYIASLFLTAGVKKQIHERTKGVAQKKISLKTFKTVQFPLPELQRQGEIMTRLNDLRQAQDDLEQSVSATEALGSRLKRSVFNSVFPGAFR